MLGIVYALRSCILILSLTVLLVGCWYCTEETYFKQNLPAGSRATSHENGFVSWHLTDEVTVNLAICDTTKQLCISVQVGENTAVQFQSPHVVVKMDNSMSQQDLILGEIQYWILCLGSGIDKKCSSSEDSPIAEVFQKKLKNTSTGYYDNYTFSSGSKFYGAKDTYEQGQYFGYRPSGARRFVVRTNSFRVDSSAFSVQLPAITINGKTYEFEPIHFSKVTEKVCRLYR